MQALARNGYTEQEVKDALHGKHGSRFLKFKYELLDLNDNIKGELSTVKSGSVSLSFFNEIKRTAKFRIKDDPLINYLTDKIKPYCLVRMPEDAEEGTTNYYDGAGELLNFGIVDANGTLSTAPYSGRYNGHKIANVIKNTGSPTSHASYRRCITFEPSIQYTVSFKVKILSGNISSIGVHRSGSNVTATPKRFLKDGWCQFEETYTNSPTTLCVGIGFIGNAAVNCLITEPQVEKKPYATSFVDGTRAPRSGFAEFPLGVFHLSSPVKKEEQGQVYRDVEAYDGLVVLLDDKFTDRHHIPAGTNYRTAVIDILTSAGITKHNIEATTKTLATDLEFEIGTEKAKACNELLRAINFRPINVDADGYYTSFTYVNPANRSSEYNYAADEISVIYNGVESELDLFNVPNKWVVVRTNSEQAPLVSTYENTSDENPTSIPSRGRTIVDKREIDNVADQVSLDAYTERIAFEASQVYGRVSFDTAIMPFHDYSDVYTFNYPALNENDKYHEVEWSFPLEAGGKMRHVARRVVQI